MKAQGFIGTILGKMKKKKELEIKPIVDNKMKTTEVIAMLLNEMELGSGMKIKVTATTQLNCVGSFFEIGERKINCIEKIELPAIEIVIGNFKEDTQDNKTIDNSFCIPLNVDYTSVYKNYVLSKGISENDLEIIMSLIADCTQNQSCYIEKGDITKIFEPNSPDYVALKYSHLFN